jgi:hypothetical protein
MQATKIAAFGRMSRMSRLDVYGDRVCVVTSFLIVGWFIYDIFFG